MGKHAVRFESIEIDLNYDSYDVDYENVLLIDKLKEDDVIDLTIEEAKWLVQELPKFIERFENTPKAKINKMITELQNGVGYNKEEAIKILSEIKELL